MDLKGKLRKGLRIFGADDREYGTIDRYDDQYAYVGERRIPVSAFERMDNDRLYLGAEGRRYFETTDRRGTEGEIRVPVVEERLNVEKRQAELGSVDIQQGRRDRAGATSRSSCGARRSPSIGSTCKDRPVAAGDEATAFEEGTIRVPVRGEEAVVEKEAVVTGEVVIDRDVTTERETVSDTVRKTRVDVDENYRRDRGAFQQHFQGRRGAAAGDADLRAGRAELSHGLRGRPRRALSRPRLRGRRARPAPRPYGQRLLGGAARGDPRRLDPSARSVSTRKERP